MSYYNVVIGEKGEKQIRFWPHTQVMPVSVAQIKDAVQKEFPGIDESELWFGAGIVNFWIERKPAKNTKRTLL